jgi:hypothetical protein
MNNGDWFSIAVVIVAFIAGYSIVSFFIKKMKSPHSSSATGEAQISHSKGEEVKFEGRTESGERSDSNRSRDSQNQHERWEGGQARRSSETWESHREEQRYARVLGLKSKVNAADVKRAYRELLAKYHPDKVNHLGEEFKRIAEARTREILHAYDYFRKKYDIK